MKKIEMVSGYVFAIIITLGWGAYMALEPDIVQAQATFQLSVSDWEVAVQAIPRHPTEVLEVINECFADKSVQDKVTADGFNSVLQVKLEAKAEHTSKRAELQSMLTGGDIVIEIDGVEVDVSRMSLDKSRLIIAP